jgi:transposase
VGLERTAMNAREFRRAEVLGRVAQGEFRLSDAAALLDLSYRQAKRLLAKFKERGRKGLVHGNVGRPSNRSVPKQERDRIIAVVREHYSGSVEGPGQRFGPTLCAEHLFSDHGIMVAPPTLRRWMIAAKLWSRARRTKRKRFKRRMRKEHFGELVQLDGSFHRWFERRGPMGCLLTMTDDATSTTLGRMDKEETTWDAAAVLKAWIDRYGAPKALYVDAKNVFVRGGTVNELAAGIKPVTHFGRMCEKLGIELIIAKTPQAKGRVERMHGTNQDRLVKKMRLRGISDYKSANEYLEEEYFPEHNRRFAVASSRVEDFHTPLDPRLDLSQVFCLEEKRVVGNDWVIRYENRVLQIVPNNRAKRLAGPGSRVLVRETREGEIFVVARQPGGKEEGVLEWTPFLAAPHGGVNAQADKRSSANTGGKKDVFTTGSVVPAGYTRSGKPLSAKQVAVRQRWDREVQRAIERREVRAARAAARTAARTGP